MTECEKIQHNAVLLPVGCGIFPDGVMQKTEPRLLPDPMGGKEKPPGKEQEHGLQKQGRGIHSRPLPE